MKIVYCFVVFEEHEKERETSSLIVLLRQRHAVIAKSQTKLVDTTKTKQNRKNGM